MSDIHVWRTNSDAQWWACAEYDHGPFCRLCVPISRKLAIEIGKLMGMKGKSDLDTPASWEKMDTILGED